MKLNLIFVLMAWIGGFLMGWGLFGTLPAPPKPACNLIEMDVSAYCPCEKCCGDWADGITASGDVAEGFLVAAPSKYPFGTLMAIPGYNNGKPVPVLDRGGAIKGNKIDLLFPTHEAALQWSRQKLVVEVLGE